MPDQSPVISIRGLVKRYRRTVAVNNLTLDVSSGEIFGFLGLNGAGKTTTIRVLLDLLRPTAGRASVFGYDCQANGLAVRAAIGYLPGEIQFYGDLTGAELLNLLDRLGRAPVAPAYRQQLLERFQLPKADLNARIREYSTGMKRKVGLVQAFQHDPKLLILDEPTEGLDPLMQEAFYELLDDVRRRGRTVFMSSHVLSEVDRVCDRVAVLRRGELAVMAPVEDLRRMAPRRIEVVFSAGVPRPDPQSLPAGTVLSGATDSLWSLKVSGPLGPFVSRLSGMPVADLRVEEPRLEDVVIEYYRGGAR